MREQGAAGDGVPGPAVSPVPMEGVAPGTGPGRALLRARAALIAAADALCDAHDYAGAARTFRVALDRWPDGDPERLAVIDKLARCAELCSEHAAAIELLRSLARAYGTSGELVPLAAVQRRLATAHELGGDWATALAAREAAAASFRQAGQLGEAATDRLAVAAHLRGAARYSSTLTVLDLVLADSRASGRADLTLRAEGMRGNVLSRLGQPAEGVPAVRAALDSALALRQLEVAAELQQRLADSLEHSGDYDGAAAAYRAAYVYCDTHGADAVGQLCRACATAVLFSRGEWSLAVDVCADVLESQGTPVHPRAVSRCLLGLIHALRGEAADARPFLISARGLSARIELTAVELLSAWGLAVLEAQAGAVTAATDRIRQALALVGETQERHYCVPFLQWAATFCATHGLPDDTLACAAALSGICSATGQAEATAALAHVLGETLMADDPAGALTELRRAAGMFGELELPFAAALAQRRGAAAAAGAGSTARELLLAARSTAERLGARPLLDDCDGALRELGTAAPARAAKKQARALAGLTARELDVMVLVAGGNTSREVGAALFISPRTVEMHVQGCLLKLGCRTRAEAVRKLAVLGALSG
ncbi:MAG TPA: helix-turn-helix transcriptional regulator [Trebonia sp.]|jgi:DNA-binding CsgD family transcriptional regulator|nr:helix-turn-helix transcriptional regulator [Trebonia sp.]